MERHTTSKSSLFLIELILSILLFSVASAICIQIFAKSHLISNDAKVLNTSVQIVQNAAALIRSEASLDTAFPDGTVTNHTFICYFNEDFQSCAIADSDYKLEITNSTNTTNEPISIRMFRDTSIVYEISIKHFRQNIKQS